MTNSYLINYLVLQRNSVGCIGGFLARAKANPQDANHGSPAAGSTPQRIGASRIEMALAAPLLDEGPRLSLIHI